MGAAKRKLRITFCLIFGFSTISSSFGQLKKIGEFYLLNGDTVKGNFINASIIDGCIEQYSIRVDSYMEPKDFYWSLDQYQIAKSAYLRGLRSVNPDTLFYRKRDVLMASGCFKNGKRIGEWFYEDLPPWSNSWCRALPHRFNLRYSQDTVVLYNQSDTNFRVVYTNDSTSVRGSFIVCLDSDNYFDSKRLFFEPNEGYQSCKFWLSGEKDQAIDVHSSCLDMAIFTALNVFTWKEFVETLDWLCQEKPTE